MNSVFRLDQASVRYGHAEVLRSISLTLYSAEFVMIAGPNGAGKSTLLSLLAGLSAPTSGSCQFLGRAATNWSRREFAQRVAVVQQTEPSEFPFTAEEVVYMGRMPHRTGMYETQADHDAVANALRSTDMLGYRQRDFRTLSGGEKQRILLASALAQQPEVLLLDEPASHLDLKHQVSLHELLRGLRRQGLLVVAVTHDLNLAAAYADRLALMNNGELRASGSPSEVLRSEVIEEVFQVRVEFHQRSSGQPWMLYGA